MRAIWQAVCGSAEVANKLRRDWRLVLKELLVLALKAFIIYQMVFMLVITLCRLVTP